MTLEQLGDEVGVPLRELPDYLHTLDAAGVCVTQMSLELQLAKGVRGDAQLRLRRLITLEEHLLAALTEASAHTTTITVALKTLAAKLPPVDGLPIRALLLATILELWQRQGRITLWQPEPHVARVHLLTGPSEHQDYAAALITALYGQLEAQTGARLRVTTTLETLLAQLTYVMTRGAPTPSAL
ncbi:MAG: hypothetical protein H0X24_04260 [Ktedonobacterales bacterium]|nr:hypothetical protein [Ktedonobacterales bacterium]